MDNIFSINEKKIVRWSGALVVFITREAKMNGWGTDTKVRVTATKDGKIVVEKVE